MSSHENKKNAAPSVEDPELSDIDREEFRLLDMQERQALVLERTGIADKARELRLQDHENMVYRLQASDIAADLPPEPALGEEGDGVRLSVALTSNANGASVTKFACVMFTATTPTEHGVNTTYSYVSVGEARAVQSYKGLPPIEWFEPLEGFNDADISTVVILLAEVDDARQFGELPHVRNDLAHLDRPDMAIAKMPVAG